MSRVHETLGGERSVWKGLATPDGRFIGDAVLRQHDTWDGSSCEKTHVLDLHVHPGSDTALEILLDAVLPLSGRVQTFLDGASEAMIRFFLGHGFALESSLRDNFNPHDPSAPDTQVYAKNL